MKASKHSVLRHSKLSILSRTAATYPIETIVFAFILVTLVYFQLLQAVKDSDFLNAEAIGSGLSAVAPTKTSPNRSATVRKVAGQERWVGVNAGSKGSPESAQEVYLHQVLLSLDPRQTSSKTPAALQDSPEALRNVQIVDEALRQHFGVAGGQLLFDPDLCSQSPTSSACLSLTYQNASTQSSYFPSPRKTILTYAFSAEAKDAAIEWMSRLEEPAALESLNAYLASVTDSTVELRLPAVFQPAASITTSEEVHQTATSSANHSEQQPRTQSGLGLSLPLSPRTGHLAYREGGVRELSGLRWLFHAIKTFMLRFWTLAKCALQKADSADIAVMLSGYVLMHATFINLFINMRQLGSKFWLACSVLVSSTFGFLFALLTAYLLNIPVNPVTLSEALPFLVLIVGFDKPFVLARAVFKNPSATRSVSRPDFTRLDLDSATDRRSANMSWEDAPLQSAGLRERPAMKSAGEIAIHAVNKHGLQLVKEYAVEIGVLLGGALSGISGLKEFCQLGALILAFDCAFLFGFYVAILTIMVEIRRIRVMRVMQRSDSTADLTRILDDGSSSPVLDSPSDSSLTYKQAIIKLVTGHAPGQKESSFNPASRLKIFLLVSFVGLHVLNLCTTLSTKTVISRHTASVSSAKYRADATSPSIVDALSHLAAAHGLGVDLVAHIASPVLLQMYIPGISVEASAISSLATGTAKRTDTPLAVLDRFMSSWTRFVGDPVMSKWIVIILAISVFLNGYLLKGIAIGTSRAEAAESAARILLAATGQIEPEEEKPGKVLRRHSTTTDPLKSLRDNHNKKRQQATEPAISEDARERTQSSGSEGEARPAFEPLTLVMPRPRRAMADGKFVTPNGTNPLESSQSSTSAAGNGAPVASAEKEGVRQLRQRPSIEVTTPSASEFGTSTPATTVDDSLFEEASHTPRKPRSLEDCISIFDGGAGATLLSDEEIILLVQKGKIAAYALEKLLKEHQRAVRIRRALISRASSTKTLETSLLPFMHYDYTKVMGQCCENVVGYTPIPVGIAGPLRIDGVALPIPMATTEGALVASTSRGCKALNAGGGVTTVLHKDAMTRGPALDFPSITAASAAKAWVDSVEGADIMKSAFNSTTRFGRLISLKTAMAGRTLFVRFACQTGDAMGMNMISKGCERALEVMGDYFPDMSVTSLSGNYCTDKKPAAINWIEGRGKSVVAEGVIPGAVVKSILKTTVADIVKLNITKNLIGSSMAGSIGGNNAHASNILTAIYLATGQDPAQNVESSNCMTLMEAVNGGEDLLITCSMPSIEVGTIGGGTILDPQQAMLDMLGVKGPHASNPGDNSRRLARVICASVMAGELSLMSALAAGHLVKSHMAHNRSQAATPNEPKTATITGHTYLTPAPTRPNTPGPGVPSSFRGGTFTPLRPTQ